MTYLGSDRDLLSSLQASEYAFVSGVRIEVVRHTQILERFHAVLSSLMSPWGFGNMAESSLSAKVTSLMLGQYPCIF